VQRGVVSGLFLALKPPRHLQGVQLGPGLRGVVVANTKPALEVLPCPTPLAPTPLAAITAACCSRAWREGREGLVLAVKGASRGVPCPSFWLPQQQLRREGSQGCFAASSQQRGRPPISCWLPQQQLRGAAEEALGAERVDRAQLQGVRAPVCLHTWQPTTAAVCVGQGRVSAGRRP
jgi:hypothetical protein